MVLILFPYNTRKTDFFSCISFIVAVTRAHLFLKKLSSYLMPTPGALFLFTYLLPTSSLGQQLMLA